jgi:hypothetical protein
MVHEPRGVGGLEYPLVGELQGRPPRNREWYGQSGITESRVDATPPPGDGSGSEADFHAEEVVPGLGGNAGYVSPVDIRGLVNIAGRRQSRPAPQQSPGRRSGDRGAPTALVIRGHLSPVDPPRR